MAATAHVTCHELVDTCTQMLYDRTYNYVLCGDSALSILSEVYKEWKEKQDKDNTASSVNSAINIKNRPNVAPSPLLPTLQKHFLLLGYDKQDRPDDGPCIVFYHHFPPAVEGGKGTFGVKAAKELALFMNTFHIPNCIFVTYDDELYKPTSMSTKSKEELNSFNITTFSNMQLKDNALVNSALYRAHVRLTPAEVDAMVAELHMKPDQRQLCKDALPTIHISDEVVRWHGWSVGDVIRVDKNYGTLQPYYIYEVIVT